MGRPSAGHTGHQRGWGRFQIEALIMALILLFPLLVSITVPVFTRSRMYGRETAAIQAVRTIQTAETQYQPLYGHYAVSLAELGPPVGGPPNASAAGLITGDLANGQRAGYKFTVSPAPGGYVINGVPAAYGSSGSRSFYSDQTMVIRANEGPEPATAQSKELRHVGNSVPATSGVAPALVILGLIAIVARQLWRTRS